MPVAKIHSIAVVPSLSGLRLFVDGRMLSNTGIGTHILEHLKGLRRLGAQVTVTVGTARDRVIVNSALDDARIIAVRATIYRVKERFRRFVIPSCVGPQDVYWFPQYNVPYDLPAASVVTIHDLIQFKYNLSLPQQLLGVVGRHVLLHAVSRAARVICPSAATKSDLLEFVAEHGTYDGSVCAKTRVIRNGVSRKWSKVSARAGVAARERVGCTPYLLCVGNGKPHKNLRLALMLGERLHAAGFPHSVVFVGPPARDHYVERELLKGYKSTSGLRVVVLREVAEEILAALYANAEVLLTPSLYEGFGLPPLEGMMAGVPVVVSNRGGLPESVGDGKHAALLDPLDVAGWYNEVVRIITDPLYRAERVAAGRKRALDMSWDQPTNDLAREILDVASRPVGRLPSAPA